MSKFTRVQKLLLGLIAVLLAFAIFTNGKGSRIKSIVYDPLMMLKYSILDYPIETIRDWMNDFNELWQVREENDWLRQRIAESDQVSAQNEDYKRENEELKKIIEIKPTIKDYNVDEKYFLETLDEMSEQAFNDQCTGANPRYPLIAELKEIYLKAYYGK